MEPSSSGRQNSWKEIASYLNASVRTVIRWEKNEGLPGHRHQHGKPGSLYAYQSELDRWQEGRADIGQKGPPLPWQAPLERSPESSIAVFGWLNHACDARSFGIHWLKIDPILDPLRADSRYRQLLKKVNLVD